MHKVRGGWAAASCVQPAVYRGWGGGCWLGHCQRIWGILVTPGAGRGGGPRLAMTQMDSGLARRLHCVESRDVAPSSSGTRETFFQKGNIGALTVKGPCTHTGWANKEGGM